MFKKVFAVFVWLIYPKYCMFCNRGILEGEICASCGQTILEHQAHHQKKRVTFIDEAYAPFYYEKNIRDAVHRYKFMKRYWYSKIFAKYMAKCIEDQPFGKYDSITWVPIGKKRYHERGFDQAKLLAVECSEILGIPHEKMIARVNENEPQSTMANSRSRVANIIGAFEVETDVSGKNILLIDDVVTTGATASECARILKTAGAAKVFLLSFATTKFRKND